MASKWYGLVVDSRDHARLARWWADVLDYKVAFEDDEEIAIVAEDGSWPGIVFVTVPEAKSVKNRLHIDLAPDDQSAEVERLLGLGARHADVGQPEDASWVVMADPEGNEFCVLTPRED